MMDSPALKRTLSLPLVTFYGLGSILGAGVYVLLGTVSGAAGYFLPMSFLCATVIAGFTAFSYAELVSRMPLSAGEAVYVDAAFKHKPLTLIVGFAAAIVGVISAATITSGFVGYFQLFVMLEKSLIVFVIVAALGGIAIIGIGISAWFATILTIVEIGGLILIVVLSYSALSSWSAPDVLRLVPQGVSDWQAISMGAFLAFYAFLGFEDMVNVAEEIKNPERNMPIAIFAALALASLLYLLVGLAAIVSVPIAALGSSATPLSLIAHAHGVPMELMAIIALLAITNGALIQMIKSSRILYGMAKLGDAPSIFAAVSEVTKTPIIATVTIVGSVLCLAWWYPTRDLASMTSLLTLSIFAIVNMALIKIKRAGEPTSKAFQVPIFVPYIGAVLSIGLILPQIFGR